MLRPDSLDGCLSTCVRCGEMKDADEFGTRLQRGVAVQLKNCASCRLKLRTAQATYSATLHGRKAIAKRSSTWNRSAAHAEALHRYHGTEAYAIAVSKYDKTPKGRAKVKRANAATMANPAKKLRKYLSTRVGDQLRARGRGCRRRQSGALLSYTEFGDSEDVLNHFAAQFTDGMEANNYGVAWEVDHRIPCKWYDHSDDDDVRRCWAKANLAPLPPATNNAKRITIPDDATLMQIGTAHWPKAWGGKAPTLEERQRMYKTHHDERMGRGSRK
jgi:hypothetical protein